VLIVRTVTVVVLDDLVEELVEGSVGVVGTSIDTDARVEVLDTGEDASFERYTLGALLVFVLVPNFLCKVPLERGLDFFTLREEGVKVLELVSVSESADHWLVNSVF
jgi:hypothetical protein